MGFLSLLEDMHTYQLPLFVHRKFPRDTHWHQQWKVSHKCCTSLPKETSQAFHQWISECWAHPPTTTLKNIIWELDLCTSTCNHHSTTIPQSHSLLVRSCLSSVFVSWHAGRFFWSYCWCSLEKGAEYRFYRSSSCRPVEISWGHFKAFNDCSKGL